MKLVLVLIFGFSFSLLSNQAIAKVDAQEAKLFWQEKYLNNSALEPSMNFPYQGCFKKSAKKYDVPVTLLLAMARGESNFDSEARSHANAVGLMQIQWPGTAKHLGIKKESDLLDPCTNIDAGARYFRELLNRFDNSVYLALAAYNYGPTAISRRINSIPDGAVWYTAYISRHYEYVVGNSSPAGIENYSSERSFALFNFKSPVRASAFVSSIEKSATDVRLDWFDKGLGYYQVVVLYQNENERKKSKKRLKQMGLI